MALDRQPNDRQTHNRQAHDDLVGLQFEMGGHLGAMSGEIVGMAGHLYLIRKDGSTHLELMELDDLRSAKFYDNSSARARAGAHRRISQTDGDAGLVDRVAHVGASAPAEQPAGALAAAAPPPAVGTASAPGEAGGKRRLSDQIKRAVNLRPAPPAGD